MLFMQRLDGDVVDTGIEDQLRELALEPDPQNASDGYAKLDRMIVDKAYAVPYGVERKGMFLSERMDAENCSRFHPVYGPDYSSFCLR